MTCSSDHGARLWDALSGEETQTLYERGVMKAVFSPDGRCVTGAAFGAAHVWDAVTGEKLRVVGDHAPDLGGVTTLAYSPDGSRIVTSFRGAVRTWDIANGEELEGPFRPHDGRVFDIAYSPDGTRIATASDDYTARIWDAARGEELHVLHHEGVVYSASYSPDGISSQPPQVTAPLVSGMPKVASKCASSGQAESAPGPLRTRPTGTRS